MPPECWVQNEFDHLVVACADLDQGAAWIRSALGVDVAPGGRHAAMGTHNRLLRLGPRAYLEIIAIDPHAPPPGRPRWFSLDQPAARDRAARAPFVATWVVRSGDIAAAVNRMPVLGDVLSLSRGPYRWRLAVPADGGLPFDGVLPAVIQWDGDAHPADALPDVGCALLGVSVTHPRADELQGLLERLGVEPPVAATLGPAAVEGRIRCPTGVWTVI
jgi:Glyoxalase-like domain